jgi:diguanylate cyclase (GGDEF)-like protein
MNSQLKIYADSLYEEAHLNSAHKAQEDRAQYLREKAARPAVSMQLPLSGPDVQRLIKIYGDDIERCMIARLETYEKAYEEDGRTPTDEDFATIWKECQDIRSLRIKQAVIASRQFISSNGGGAQFLPDETNLAQASGRGHDRALHKWKIWKAKAQLKTIARSNERERQLDVLMPLYNRAEFNRDLAELARASSESSPVSLLFMDLDKLKSINDGPGAHAAGDRALIAFGEAVLSAVEGKGTAYRYGGDEVCALLGNHTIAEARVVAERVRQNIEAAKTPECPDGLRSSIGLACFPESTRDSSQLCRLADHAMYISKKAGGNRVSVIESGDSQV